MFLSIEQRIEIEERIIPAIKRVGKAATDDKTLAMYIMTNHADEFDVLVDNNVFEIVVKDTEEKVPSLEDVLKEIFGHNAEHHCDCGGECDGGCSCHCECDETTDEDKFDEIIEKLENIETMLEVICMMIGIAKVNDLLS